MTNARIQPAPGEKMNGAMKVSGAPDPRFNGREVFMMAIQMPNITSWSGSWLMWYSDRTLREAGLAPIAPPVAHRKVDPKYIASAVAERIEGRVTLACVVDKTGHVVSVELVRGIDDRLNKSAEEALSKWEFYPATRKGEPVEVDVLVEIPFHLEPRIERR
jgi:TonB family protein